MCIAAAGEKLGEKGATLRRHAATPPSAATEVVGTGTSLGTRAGARDRTRVYAEPPHVPCRPHLCRTQARGAGQRRRGSSVGAHRGACAVLRDLGLHDCHPPRV